MGNTPGAARNELEETLRCVKEDGDDAFIRPDWLDVAVSAYPSILSFRSLMSRSPTFLASAACSCACP